MATRHIITIDHQDFAVESAAQATQLLTLLAKLQKVRLNIEADSSRGWFYEDDPICHRQIEVSLKLNQPYRAAKPEKPSKPEKPLALPKPKKGSIQCICEHSYVAPRESCAHCGRTFAESHNRTHSDPPAATPKPQLRLL
jgi:hypothetical protein